MKPIKRDNSHKHVHSTIMPPSTSGREFTHKADKKLKADKLYRYQCGGFIDKGSEKMAKGLNVVYKAEFERPVEEFIYPSLKYMNKEESRKPMDFSSASDSKPSNLTWRVNLSEVEAAEIPRCQTVMHKVEKGERYLRENMKSKYHGRVLAEAKRAEEIGIADAAKGLVNSRRENVLKSMGFLKSTPEASTPDDLVCPSHLIDYIDVCIVL